MTPSYVPSNTLWTNCHTALASILGVKTEGWKAALEPLAERSHSWFSMVIFPNDDLILNSIKYDPPERAVALMMQWEKSQLKDNKITLQSDQKNPYALYYSNVSQCSLSVRCTRSLMEYNCHNFSETQNLMSVGVIWLLEQEKYAVFSFEYISDIQSVP